MKTSSLIVVIFTTVLAYSTFYMPQPMLPLIAQEFGVTATDAALLIAITMVPLGFAPIFYGYLTEYVSTKRLLLVTVGLLTVSQFALSEASAYWNLVALRFAQGLLLPAIFTSLMTYSAQSAKASKVRNAINVYVSATIFGGFSGRLLGGVLSDVSSWRLPFLLTSGLLLLSCALLATLPSENKTEANKIELGAARRILGQPFYRDAYLCIFLVFFVFASMLNYLPFRLKSIDPEISESMLSLLYLGYLSGSLIAFNGSRIADWFDGELRGVFAGLLLLGCGIGATLIPNLLSTYLVAFAMCAAFFLAHSLLAAYLNHHTRSSRGVVNGLYLSFYYSGGALGGWLPGFIYRAGGWSIYVIVLLMTLSLAIWWLWRMRLVAE
ncbi:MAG: MFS transporter [Gammaproteobacteria bacterium]